MSGGFAAILARLRAPQLRLHCDDALGAELDQVQHQLQAVRGALHRLREVARAARSLGSEDTAASLGGAEHAQRSLGRAVAALGAGGYVANPPTRGASSYVYCQCRRVDDPPTTATPVGDAPLLAEPDTAALSPPRRAKPPPKRKLPVAAQKLPRAPRRKLVIPRRHSPVQEEEEQQEEDTPHEDDAEPPAEAPEEPTTTTPIEVKAPVTPKKEKAPKKEKKTRAKKDPVQAKSPSDAGNGGRLPDPDDVVIVEDDSDSCSGDDESGEDPRARLQRHIDACWPLATQLGALEMPQRRRADFANLVGRVRSLFRTLLACAVEDVASRSMRSVLVKARDSLAVAVSLLSLHYVTDETAPLILALVKAVDAASEKHATLQKQIVPFRNSLADIEVALLTHRYSTNHTPKKETRATRKKPHKGR